MSKHAWHDHPAYAEGRNAWAKGQAEDQNPYPKFPEWGHPEWGLYWPWYWGWKDHQGQETQITMDL